MRSLLVIALVAGVPGNVCADRVTLRAGTLAVDGSRYMQDMQALAKEIRTRTHGAVRIEWMSGGQLGDEVAMADQLKRGTLDAAGLSETGLVALVPEMTVWRYPGLLRSYAEVDRATAALGPSVRDQFAKRDLVFVMWADLGFSQIFSTEPITTLRDLLRAATPWIAMPLDGKLTAAIAGGKARAWALPPLYMLAIGGAKPRYVADLKYRYVVGGLVMTAAGWAKLAVADQAIVGEVCRDFEPRLRASWRRESDRGLAALAKSGVTVHVVPTAERAGFADASAKTWTTPADLVAKILAAR
ncbi:MAG: TRAP transporter substrate-binding protein DctP [Kofleriaceae bacterium]